MREELRRVARRLLEAEVAAETAVFQRDVAWARLAAGEAREIRPAGAWSTPPLSVAPESRPDESRPGSSTPPDGDPAEALRIALVATPRTGNTWIRTLLAEAWGLRELAVHTPTDVPWRDLPGRLVVQLHWHRFPCFRAALDEFGFRVVTIARDPLDVLVSVLQFCQKDRTTEFWLSGEGGDETELLGLGARDPGFLRWALSGRARALLSVTKEWWADGETIRVRYEDAVAAPAAALAAVAGRLGVRPLRDVDEVGSRVSLEEMRRRFAAFPGHFWKGRPGGAAEVLTPEAAAQIAAFHAPVFRALEYPRRPAETPPAEPVAPAPEEEPAPAPGDGAAAQD